MLWPYTPENLADGSLNDGAAPLPPNPTTPRDAHVAELALPPGSGTIASKGAVGRDHAALSSSGDPGYGEALVKCCARPAEWES